MKKVKKVVASIIAFLIALPVKVLSTYTSLQPQIDYGIPRQELGNRTELYWNIVKIFVIPITLLLGLLIYVKRKPESKIKRFLPAIITLIFSPLMSLIFVFILVMFKIN